MKTKLLLFGLTTLFFNLLMYAQVGVGNTNPQAQLDISASSVTAPTNEDGILIPRVSNLPTVGSMTANQDGMMVFYTGSGADGKGFYYWDDTGNSWIKIASGNSSDNQNISLIGTTLSIEDGNSVNLSSIISDTDDQTLSLSGTILSIADGNSVNLFSLQDGTGTDNQNLLTPSLVGTTLNLGIENGTGTSINLASLQDGTGTDNQNLLTPSLSGTTLNLGIENGTGTSINLASLQDGIGTDDQSINTFSFNNSSNILTLQIEDDPGGAQTVNLSTLAGGSDSTTASNGLTEVTDDILLGGALTQNTTINQGNFDMHFQLGSGSTADFQVIRGGSSNLITAGNNGYILLGDTASLPDPRLQVNGGANFGSYMADFYNYSANSNAAAVSIRIRTSIPHSGNYLGFFKNNNTLTGHINGNGSGGVNYSTVSDRRLKTSILDIDNSLDLINKMQPKIYEYKAYAGKKEYGFIAQELQEVYPQAVSGDPNGDVNAEPMMVDYGRITPILTAGIQELQQEVLQLKKENELLKQQLSELQKTQEQLMVLVKSALDNPNTSEISNNSKE